MTRSSLASLLLLALFATGCGTTATTEAVTVPGSASTPPISAALSSATLGNLPNSQVAVDLPAGADPNVLLVILDDIGLDYFPGYQQDQGFDKAPMPTIEGLMDDGFVFENLHTYATCSPTRASLLTGKHGVETGVLEAGRTSLLDTRFQSIQEELDAQTGGAIATSLFGKWHLVGNQADSLADHPNQFGIDHYAGMLAGTHDDYSNWSQNINGVTSTATTYSTTEFTDDAIDWIGDQDGQWFTWLAYTAPHTPLHLPPADLHTFDALSGDDADIRRNPDQYFQAMLESVDTEIGRLLDSFDTETRDNTFVFVIGDNGSGGRVTQSRYGDVGAKGSLHVGGVNTPMIAYSPYHDGGGTRHDSLVSTIDYFPTILDLFGLDASTDVQGSSFAPLIADQADEYVENDHVFVQNLEATAVRSQTHKLIRFETGEERYYDISIDPFEENNLLPSTLDAADQTEYERLSELLDRFADGDYDQTAAESDTPTVPGGGDTIQSDFLDPYVIDDTTFGTSTTVTFANGARRIVTNALPNHETGEFPGPGNPNEIAPQDDVYEFPLVPRWSGTPTDAREPGVSISGVKFAPGTAERVTCASGETYSIEGFQDLVDLGLDASNAHVQSDGSYHYHGTPIGIVDFADRGDDLVHVGFAADGYLMVYSKSGAYSSGWRLDDTPRTGTDCIRSGPRGDATPIDGTAPDGTFTSDWVFDPAVGDLDECNGITIDGQYVYLVTMSFPYVSRCLMGDTEIVDNPVDDPVDDPLDGLEPCNGKTPTMVAPADGSPVVGTDGPDVIVGTDGADTIDGAGGDDTICAGNGDDVITGGPGDDKLFGGQGADRIDGGDGDDTLHGNRGDDLLNGDAGADKIFGYSENDTISGGDGDDRLHGNFGDDDITGDAGNDTIFGYGDNDVLNGGDGADLIGGNFGDDVISGGPDDDVLYGSDGTDTVTGGAGNDVVQGNSGDDTVSGNSGNDTLDGGINTDICDGGPDTDTATRCETLISIP